MAKGNQGPMGGANLTHRHWKWNILRRRIKRVRTNFWTDRNLHGSAFRLHGTRGTAQVSAILLMKRCKYLYGLVKRVLQSGTEFGQFRVNGLHRFVAHLHIRPFKNLSGPKASPSSFLWYTVSFLLVFSHISNVLGKKTPLTSCRRVL